MDGTLGTLDQAALNLRIEAQALAVRLYGLTPADRATLCGCISCLLGREEVLPAPDECPDAVCPGCGRRHSRTEDD
jgi:hypothetical protein